MRVGAIIGILTLLVLSTLPALPAPAQNPCQETIDSTGITAAQIDDFTTHSYTAATTSLGDFHDCVITRTFAHAIQSLKVTIVAGQADDIGYVGGLLVTTIPMPCQGLGTVTGPIDVTSQVSIAGNQATLVLRAQDTCCCLSGWGDALPRPPATLHWQVTLAGGTGMGTTGSPGFSVSPSTLDFGTQEFGTRSAPQTVTVSNNSGVPVTINSVSVSDPRNFALLDAGLGTLAPGASRTISVAFTPINVSAVSATLSISDDAPGSPQTVQLLGNGANPVQQFPADPEIQPQSLAFGNQELGTSSAARTVTVLSRGQIPLEINSVTVSGLDASDFTITGGAGPATLAGGATQAISVAFSPTSLGPRTGNLLIATNGPTYLVTLSGAGVQAVRPPIQPLNLRVGQPVAHATGLEFVSDIPAGPGDNDAVPLRGVAPDGSLLLADWAGTALIQLPPPYSTANVLLDPANPLPPDGVGLARLLRVEVSPSGMDAIFALRADNTLGIYRLANGSLSLLGQLSDPRAARELALSDAGQIAYVANVDPSNPASPLALYLAPPAGAGMELLRQGQSTVNGGAIQSFSDLTGNASGDLSLLVGLPGGGQAVLRKLGAGAVVPVVMTGQTVERGRGSGTTGVLTALRRPQIGPGGSVVFLGAGSDFVNFYLVLPDGTLQALLPAPGTDLSIVDGSPLPGSSGRRFDYAIAADGSVALQATLANSAASALMLVSPNGQVTTVAAGQPPIEPILPPVFGPGGRLFFLAEDRVLPSDRNGRYLVGLYRYRPGAAAPEAVAMPGPNQVVPGWPADTQLLGISQPPLLSGNSLFFGVLFGGPQSLPVPTAAFFQVPLDGTLAGGTVVALEGHPEENASRLAMLRALSHQSGGALVVYGLMPGAGSLIAPPPALANAAGRFHTQAAVAPPIVPLVAEGDDLGAGKVKNIIPPLVSLAPNRALFGARTSLTQTQPFDWDHEGLFTSHRETVAETRQSVPALPGAFFNGFADTQLYLLSPPSVAPDGRVVFKALLDQNQFPLAGVFQWSVGAPTLLMAADPDSLIGWAANKGGLTYLLARLQGGPGRLYLSTNGLMPTPLSSPGLTDLADLALNSNGDVFVVGSGSQGVGVFQLMGSQSIPVPVALQGMMAPASPGTLAAGYRFDGSYFKLAPDSSRGKLIFRATISNGSDQRLGEFQLGRNGLLTRGVVAVSTPSARTLSLSALDITLPSQSNNDTTVSANLQNGHWSLVVFRGDGPAQTIVQEGQMLPNGAQIKVLDAGALLQQDTDLKLRSGPVFTIDDQGNVAFLASDGQGWGVYQSPAPPPAARRR